MKNIEFVKNNNKEYEVNQDNEKYGILTFDEDQALWVLWPESIDDAIGYYDDLEETIDEIRYELTAFDDGITK